MCARMCPHTCARMYTWRREANPESYSVTSPYYFPKTASHQAWNASILLVQLAGEAQGKFIPLVPGLELQHAPALPGFLCGFWGSSGPYGMQQVFFWLSQCPRAPVAIWRSLWRARHLETGAVSKDQMNYDPTCILSLPFPRSHPHIFSWVPRAFLNG